MSTDDRSNIISSPTALAELATRIASRLAQTPISTIELQLLAPLSTESMLSRCLNDEESVRSHSYGPTTVKKDAIQVLSLRPLFVAWRKAWVTFPSDAAQHFVFRIELPTSIVQDACTDSRIYWRNNVPESGGLVVFGDTLGQFVVVLASLMRRKSKRLPRFSLIWADENVALRPQDIPKYKAASEGLNDVLKRLSASSDSDETPDISGRGAQDAPGVTNEVERAVWRLDINTTTSLF
ncbi:unnamed protein product [Aureobasidium uvarum]|uniref:Uncharacterized protein n=1 Tax=Aureobasidium uvarum TaxID=2773716 RepID=A0A9N8PPG3_9PEZI|nr:unnamed protein product [Aureobasidium uvarum]